VARDDLVHSGGMHCKYQHHPKVVVKRLQGSRTRIAISTPCDAPRCRIRRGDPYDRAERLVLAISEYMGRRWVAEDGYTFGEIQADEWTRLRDRVTYAKGWALRIPTPNGIYVAGGPQRAFRSLSDRTPIEQNPDMSHRGVRPLLYGTFREKPNTRSELREASVDTNSGMDPNFLVYLLAGVLGQTTAGYHGGEYVRGVSVVGLSSSQPRQRHCPTCGYVWNAAERRRNPDRNCLWCDSPTDPVYEEMGWATKEHTAEDIIRDHGELVERSYKAHNATIYTVEE
jgi:hypothetical protein